MPILLAFRGACKNRILLHLGIWGMGGDVVLLCSFSLILTSSQLAQPLGHC